MKNKKTKSSLEIFEETGDVPKWKPVVGAAVEVFEDPLTQHRDEGLAKIVKIHRHDKFSDYGLLDCDVRFYMDSSDSKLEDIAVRRQIKYSMEAK